MAASLALGQRGAEGSAVTGEALSPLLAESGAWVPQCVEQGPAMPDELVSTMVQAQSGENKWGWLDSVIRSNWRPMACGCATTRCRDVSARGVYSLGCPCHTPSCCDY